MPRKYPRTQAILSCLVMGSMLVHSGCQAGIFKKPDDRWKRPTLPSLAFWKKKDSQEIPPPPASHFTPSKVSESVADSSNPNSSNSSDSDLQQKFNQLAASSEQKKAQLAEEIKRELDQKPIRQPYSMPDAKQSLASSDTNTTSTVSASNSPMTMNQAQQDFQAALASSNQALKNSMSNGQAAANEFAASASNDFQATSNIAAEAKQKIAQAKSNLSASTAEINQNLYNSAGQLSSGIKSQTQTFQNSMSNFSTAANNVQTSELKAMQDQVALAQQQIAELKQQIAETKRQSAALAANMSSSVNSFANGNTSNGLEPIAHTAQLDLNNTRTTPTNQNFSPLDRGSQSDAGMGLPQNQLRSGAPLSPINNDGYNPGSATPNQQNYPSTPHGGYQPLSATPPLTGMNNSFSVQPASLASPTTQNATSNEFDFGGTSNSQSKVVQATGQNSTEARMDAWGSSSSHVSDVDIPAAVLQGKGSYAPGTVNRLLP